jgi:hypothetical protein
MSYCAQEDLVLNQNSKKVQGKKPLKVSYVGKHFKLHSFKRKSPVLKKLGAGDKIVRGRVLTTPVVNRSLRLPRGHFPKKRGHPMVDHYRESKGRRVSYLETAPTFTPVLQYDQQTVCLYDWLSNVQTAHGDFKKPTAQRFTHHIKVYMEGSIYRDTYSNGKLITHSWAEGVGIRQQQDQVWKSFPDTTTYNKALSRLYDKLRGDIDVSIDLAESHKTHKMMADTFRGMLNLATTFRKMKRSNPRDWGNLWLEYTYGWRPLVSTIYGAATKLLNPDAKSDLTFNLHATASENLLEGTRDVTNQPDEVQDHYRFYQKARCRFVVRFRVKPSALITLGGFTSLNPVSIAWEVTPYSFVVDWFVNIGGYLRDFENALLYGTSFADGYVTETCIGEAWCSQNGSKTTSDGFGGSTVTIAQLSSYERYTEKRRVVLTTTPFPRIPKFDPHLGASRLISGAALLGQMLTSLEHSKGYGDPRPPNSSRMKEAGRQFEKASKDFTRWSEQARIGLGRSRP